jgi:RNA polymerase sigma factor (sigma-70 family)
MDFVEFLLRQEDAKALASVFQDLSDDDYCSFLDSVEAGGTNAITAFSWELLSRCFRDGQYAAHERQALWRWLAGALAIAAGNEFARRCASNETRIGEVMRTWAGRGPSGLTQEELQTVTKKALWGRYHPDGEEEAHAAFAEALVERMAQKMRTFFSSSLGQQMRMCLRGDLERVPSQADNVVREQVRRLAARPDQLDENSFPVEIKFEQEINEQLLFAEVLAAVDPRERKVLELDLQGWKQEEIAAQLAISQPRVSQIRGKAKEKIRRALKTRRP